MGAIIIIVIAMLAAFLPRKCEEQKNSLMDTDKTQKQTFPVINRRLPDDIQPEHYELQIETRLKNWTFSGSVTILIKVKKSTSSIILHSLDHTNIKITIDEKKPKSFKVDPFLQQLQIRLNKPMEVDKTYELKIKYDSVIYHGLDGFYRSTFKHKGREYRLATTQMEPNGARRAFPCFDEPAYKANFSISIIHANKYTAISNMPGKSSKYDEERTRTVFDNTVKMSTYLVAFVVYENFKYFENVTDNNIAVRVYAPAFEVKKTKFALNTAKNIITFYEKLFDIKFPLPKSDMIAIPDFSAGAMENWGLITYRRTAILYDEKTGSGLDKQWVSIVIAHELAHQWFGNLVTMKWWNDLWLNEGFASFVEYLGSDEVNPSLKTVNIFIRMTFLCLLLVFIYFSFIFFSNLLTKECLHYLFIYF